MDKKLKTVFTIIEKNQPNSEHKNIFMRVGSGWVNSDGSITLRLDALPVNGVLQVRDYLSEQERMERRQARLGMTSVTSPTLSAPGPLGMAE